MNTSVPSVSIDQLFVKHFVCLAFLEPIKNMQMIPWRGVTRDIEFLLVSCHFFNKEEGVSIDTHPFSPLWAAKSRLWGGYPIPRGETPKVTST